MSEPLLFHLLLRCGDAANLRSGRCIHGHVIKLGSYADFLLGNGVVSMYSKCRSLPEASAAFRDMTHRDAVSYNSLINAYSQHAPQHSLSLFRTMRAHREDSADIISPNAFTYAGVFTAAASAASPVGVQAHCAALKSGECDDVFVGTCLLNFYSRVGLVNDARKVFDAMPSRNLVTWAAMISGYAGDRCGASAFRLFRLMLEDAECVPNEFVITGVLSAVSLPEFLEMGRQVHGFLVQNGLVSFVPVENSLVTFYSKCERLDDAAAMFASSGNKNSVMWSAMVTGCAQNGDSARALLLFSRMHSEGVFPNEFTFVGVLNACSDRTALAEGRQAHAYLVKLGFELQVYIKSALVDMYAKCGSVDDARKGFDQLNDARKADTVLWTTMIGGYAKNGEQEEALALYGKMQNETALPNNLTMTTVLRACSSLAALEQGKQIHGHAIKYGFSLGIPLGSALSTLYAKCGNLEDCNLVFRRMPERDTVAWNSIISGFSQNGRGLDALNLYEEMKSEGAHPDHVTFVNVLVACSHMGLVERGWGYFSSMYNDHGIVPGIEHYACMVDILSRAGMLREAKGFVESVPIDHGMCLWRIVLGACRDYRNYDVGAYAGERLMELGSPDSSAYILLSNIYAAWRRWDDVERVRRTMRMRGVNKEPGCSWVELQSRVHVFVAGELLHPEIEDTYSELKRLIKHMKDEGYRPAASGPGSSHHDQPELDIGLRDEEEFPLLVSVCS